MEFVDNYRLFVCTERLPCKDPSCIVLIDTEKCGGGVPVQTTFQLPPCLDRSCLLHILLEHGGHDPPPAESRAPFNQDPTQRILALAMPHTVGYLIFRVEAFLKLLEGHEGSAIRWDEWKSCVAIPSFNREYGQRAIVWVSGSRLFCLKQADPSPGACMKVYDFSAQGRAKYLSEQVNEKLGGIKYLLPTEVDGWAPWNVKKLYDANGGHDGVVLYRVSIAAFSFIPG